jgi:hypothetical protein
VAGSSAICAVVRIHSKQVVDVLVTVDTNAWKLNPSGQYDIDTVLAICVDTAGRPQTVDRIP